MIPLMSKIGNRHSNTAPSASYLYRGLPVKERLSEGITQLDAMIQNESKFQ